MVELFILKLLARPGRQSIRGWLALLPRHKRKRSAGQDQSLSALQSLAGELLLRWIIAGKTRLPPGAIRLRRNRYGKPFLTTPRGLHFSIAHSGRRVICAVSRGRIGADIEKIRPVDAVKLARRFFAPAERDALLRRRAAERLPFFFELWTLKESYLKAVGKGLLLPLRSFTILRQGQGFCLKTGAGATGRFHLKSYSLVGGYRIGLCAAEKILAGEPKPVTLDIILRGLNRRRFSAFCGGN